ncbi:hypothetical protein Poly24_32730 [Rosistilla carotiformis]|uniref:DUF447 family protein n=1 Tax=Rosistilla carotiformis TaxID=2528017 RepID=A0A518JVJ5_9BACT|nr:DUF447 domain-containing protein [Rosistilla carotiformis]QDV69557.1 hypothetical protein Poly24_32730 [Rosistilla carotiformis]
MILESLVTSVNANGEVNVAPMGPVVDREITTIELRPFKTSTTHGNLRATSRAVVHVTDDVLMIARAAIGRIEPPVREIEGGWFVLENASRWFAIEVVAWNDDPQRPTAECAIVRQGSGPPFFGLNRAKHAVIEAAILATRTHLIPAAEIAADLERLRVLIDKTGGAQEHEAFELLRASIAQQVG